MTRDEAKKLIMVITSSYPNFKPADMSMTVDVWANMLSEYEYDKCAMALKTYIMSDTSGFAPSIGQLIGKMNVVDEMSEMTGLEAWGYVSRALRDSTYHAQERFDELPPLVKKAVGSPDNLRAWGMDEGYNENVAQSQFIKSYNTLLERKKEINRMPVEVRAMIEQTSQKLIGEKND